MIVNKIDVVGSYSAWNLGLGVAIVLAGDWTPEAPAILTGNASFDADYWCERVENLAHLDSR